MTSETDNSSDQKSNVKIISIHRAMKDRFDNKIIKRLLQKEIDVNRVISKNQPNLLFTANNYHSQSTFNLLLDLGADFTCKNEKGNTVLHELIPDDRYDWLIHMCKFDNSRVDSVLAAHVKFDNFSNPADKNGITHFHVACMTDNVAAVEFFLKNGVDVDHNVNANSPIFTSYSPLHFAVHFACSEILKTLLKYEANVYLKNAEGLTPLHVFIKTCTKWLPLNEVPEYEETFNTFMKFIINESNDDIEICDEYGICNLHAVCLIQDESFVESILERVTNVNLAVNFDSPVYPGYTPLHFAALSSVKNFKLLVKNRADLEAKNARGETAFDLFLQKSKIRDIYDILLTKNEWRNIILSDNKTKLIDLVCVMKDDDEFNCRFSALLSSDKSLIKTFVPFDSVLWPGYTILHLAVALFDDSTSGEFYFRWERGSIGLIKTCLSKGADMTAKNAEGATALHLAFRTKKTFVVEFMLNYQDKLENSIDENNLSYFHIACAQRCLKTVKQLLSMGVDVNGPVHSTFQWLLGHEISRPVTRKHFFVVSSGSTPLHISVANGNIKLTKILLKHGADVNAQDVNGFTPVHRLLFMKNVRNYDDIVESLLSEKNLKNCVSEGGLSHLHVACHLQHSKAIKKQLKDGADVNAIVTYKSNRKIYDNDYYVFDHCGDPDGPLDSLNSFSDYTPLHFLIRLNRGNEKIIQLLINHGTDFTRQNAGGVSFLNYLSDHIDIAISTLNNCVALQKYFEVHFGMTKLHLACCTADFNLAKNSLELRTNINAKISSDYPIWKGYTPLHVAAVVAYEKGIDNKLKKIVDLLIKNRADLIEEDDNRNTPFHIHLTEMRKNRSKIISVTNFLFSHLKNYNVNATNPQGISLFHVACYSENTASVKNFLNDGVDVNQAIDHLSDIDPGCTPLHLAVKYYEQPKQFLCKIGYSNENSLQIIDMLLKNNANVNAFDAVYNTPLFDIIASRRLRRILIPKLISNGSIDLHATNLNGVKPFELLLSQKNILWDEIEVFLKAGCSFDSYNPVTQAGYIAIAFRYHCQSNAEILKNQILHGIITNPRTMGINDEGRTALHNVISLENHRMSKYNDVIEQIVELLTLRGCDIDHQDKEGNTALHLAVKLKNFSGIAGLLRNGADVNLIDKNGKTAHDYYEKEILDLHNWSGSGHRDMMIQFSRHVRKLQFCALRVSEKIERLQSEVLKEYSFHSQTFDHFNKSLERTKNAKIGDTSFLLYDFLTGTNMDVFYTNMTSEERREVDEFFTKINKSDYPEIYCVIKLKYRQTIERTKLIEPALIALRLLSKIQLPDLCCRYIASFLKN